jgi:hypothetical protein
LELLPDFQKVPYETPAQLQREKRTEINNRALMYHFYPEIIPFPAYSRPEFHGQLHCSQQTTF